MDHIKTRCDLDHVQRQLSKPMRKIAASYLEELFAAIDWPDDTEPRLDSGHIVIFDTRKDDWRAVLKPHEPWQIEYVERLTLLDGEVVYKVVKLVDNDFIMTYFVEAGTNSPLDAWLKEIAEDGGINSETE